ncbi:MAG: carboxypeptidase regulatory-like domain-containing protein [Siphonobacter sp.]
MKFTLLQTKALWLVWVLVAILAGSASAQVTTSAIVGRVTDSKGEALPGATIQAIHEPTGSNYATITSVSGQYTLPNLRVGGPYTITVSYVGFSTEKLSEVTVTLGTPLTLNITLQDAANTLKEVTITAGNGSVISSTRNGTSTFVSPQLMQGVPTISRSVQDFARLMPQAKVGNSASSGNNAGISFGGQNNRYNQFTVDGANANDGFGLSSSGTNGGQANINPISIESIQEMQIVMSPYDITQGGFTGGGINAVTKSGTNTFHGAVYGQTQNQNFVGKSPKYNETITRNSYGNFTNSTYGISLGGPIIKNKLFFFANVERFKKSTPLAYDPTLSGSGSKVDVSALETLRNFLIENYQYDPGTYGAINNDNQSTSVFARLDWNINNKHRLALRFNHVNGTLDNLSRSATSAIFSNSGYGFSDKNNSAVLELNSTFSAKASNVLRLTYSAIRDSRTTSAFPNLTIYNYNTDQAATISYNIGSDYSSAVNGLDQDVFTITDNFTLYKGNHTLTFGTNNEFFNSKNLFLQGYYGSYTYGTSSTTSSSNISNFMSNTGLTSYSVGYSTSSDVNDKAPANLHAAQFSVYGQDIWSVNNRIKLTYGLRLDIPVFFNKPAENTAFNTAFESYGVKTNQMPKSRILASPRIGFNWDVKGDASTQLRGGAGIFTGRVPFVWISNQISNTGVASKSYSLSSASAVTAAGVTFNYDPSDAHLGAYIPSSSSSTTVINVIDKNFKFPQVFRANLAVDQKLNVWGLIGTVEGIFTKTLNNANYTNLNLSENGESTVAIGPTSRPYWSTTLNTSYTQVLKLTNTNQGFSYNLTAQIQKPASKGWSGSIAYSYGRAKSLNDLTSSVALSNWRSPLVINGLNHPDLAISNYNMGSRFVGFLTKEFKYAKNFSTSFTLIYTGQSGQRFSYVYGSNILGDYGSSSGATALVYVPTSLSEANFVDITNGATASEQWANFQSFMNANSYLKDHAGKNTSRNGDKMPFENHFDLRIAQNFIVGRNKLQVFFDVLNIGNMLNKDWGRSYATSTSGDGLYTASTSLFTVVSSGSQTQDGVALTPTAAKPAFQFNINNMTKINDTYRPYSVADFTSRWNAQIGARYSF